MILVNKIGFELEFLNVNLTPKKVKRLQDNKILLSGLSEESLFGINSIANANISKRKKIKNLKKENIRGLNGRNEKEIIHLFQFRLPSKNIKDIQNSILEFRNAAQKIHNFLLKEQIPLRGSWHWNFEMSKFKTSIKSQMQLIANFFSNYFTEENNTITDSEFVSAKNFFENCQNRGNSGDCIHNIQVKKIGKVVPGRSDSYFWKMHKIPDSTGKFSGLVRLENKGGVPSLTYFEILVNVFSGIIFITRSQEEGRKFVQECEKILKCKDEFAQIFTIKG